MEWEELKRLSDICLKHGVKIVSDDVYCGLIYPGVKYIPISTISQEVSMNSIICYSASKIYNTSGIKHSFVVCENKELMDAYKISLGKLDLGYGLNMIGLAITEAAYNYCDPWLSELMEYVEGNYMFIKDTLAQKMPLVKLTKPQATYVAWLDCRGLNLSDELLTELFEKHANISVEMGYKYGKVGSGFVRINMGCRRALLKEGVDRLINAYNKLYA